MKNSINKTVLTLLFGLFALVPIVMFTPHFASKEIETISNYDQNILSKIDVNRIYDNISTLAKNPRVAGTEQEDRAVEFIVERFTEFGYKPEVQAFSYKKYTSPHTVALSIEGFNGKLTPNVLEYSDNGKVSGEIIPVGLGKVDELQKLNLSNKIALIQRGDISFAEKVTNAIKNGAVGVILYNNEPGVIGASLGETTDVHIPVVLLTKEEGENLIKHKEKNHRLFGTLSVIGATTNQYTSHNVVAVKEATTIEETNDIIVIGSHHDSVAEGPGANDDASGSAMTLELARILKNIPSSSEIRFITFGAEEDGLLGSSHYVQNLSANEKKRIVANFNLDMVGSDSAGELTLQTSDGKPNLVTDLSQTASRKLNGEATPYNQGERSDHVSFAEAGIPAALFIHYPTEKWYHTAEDSIDKISKEKLQDVAEIIALAVLSHISVQVK